MTRCVAVEELCIASGLSRADVWELEAAGLLLPTHTDPAPSYRPRLVGWARKLAYLRGEGWTLDEIRMWVNGRWSTANPRQWPRDRYDWQPLHARWRR